MPKADPSWAKWGALVTKAQDKGTQAKYFVKQKAAEIKANPKVQETTAKLLEKLQGKKEKVKANPIFQKLRNKIAPKGGKVDSAWKKIVDKLKQWGGNAMTNAKNKAKDMAAKTKAAIEQMKTKQGAKDLFNKALFGDAANGTKKEKAAHLAKHGLVTLGTAVLGLATGGAAEFGAIGVEQAGKMAAKEGIKLAAKKGAEEVAEKAAKKAAKKSVGKIAWEAVKEKLKPKLDLSPEGAMDKFKGLKSAVEPPQQGPGATDPAQDQGPAPQGPPPQ